MGTFCPHHVTYDFSKPVRHDAFHFLERAQCGMQSTLLHGRHGVYCTSTHKFHQTPNTTPPFGHKSLHRRRCVTQKQAQISAKSIEINEVHNETHHFLSSNATLFKHNSNVMHKGVLIGIFIFKAIEK